MNAIHALKFQSNLKRAVAGMRTTCAYQRTRHRNMGIVKKTCEGFGRLFGKGRLFGRRLSNKPSGTINPVYLPQTTPEQPKNVSINKTLSITTLAQYFYPATYEEHPINNHDLDRVLLWKLCHEWTLGYDKKCINSYTGLGVGWYWRASSWPTSETYTCHRIIYSWTVVGLLKSAVLSCMTRNAEYLVFNSCPLCLSCNFGGTSHEQPWPWSCSVLEIMQWKFGNGKKCAHSEALILG